MSITSSDLMSRRAIRSTVGADPDTATLPAIVAASATIWSARSRALLTASARLTIAVMVALFGSVPAGMAKSRTASSMALRLYTSRSAWVRSPMLFCSSFSRWTSFALASRRWASLYFMSWGSRKTSSGSLGAPTPPRPFPKLSRTSGITCATSLRCSAMLRAMTSWGSSGASIATASSGSSRV